MKYTPLRQLTVCSITTGNNKLDVQDLYIENLGTTFIRAFGGGFNLYLL